MKLALHLVAMLCLAILSTNAQSVQEQADSDKKLLAKLTYKDFYKAGTGTLAEFRTNEWGRPETKQAIRVLSGESPGDKEAARAKLSKLLAEAQLGFAWPEPPKAEIPFCAKPPLLDGRLDDASWAAALTFRGELQLGSLAKDTSEAIWKIMWDEQFLYVGAEFDDASVVSYSYQESRPEKQPWDGDCLEVFLLPEKRMRVYWEIVVNPANEVFDGLHQSYRWGGFSGHPEEDLKGLKTATRRTESGYAVELAIPFKELPSYTRGNAPKPGESLCFTFVRTDNGQRKAPCPFLYDGHNLNGYVQGVLTGSP